MPPTILCPACTDIIPSKVHWMTPVTKKESIKAKAAKQSQPLKMVDTQEHGLQQSSTSQMETYIVQKKTTTLQMKVNEMMNLT